MSAKGATRLEEVREKEVDALTAKAQDFLRLQGAALRVAIQDHQRDKTVLANDIVFKSIALADYLKDSTEILLLGATAGQPVHEEIRRAAAHDDLTRSVVFDAVASVAVDGALSWIMDYFYAQLRRENKAFGHHRFSCGYADFDLENQRALYQVLQLEKFGVKLAASFMFVPEKTVTAVVGIKNA